MTGWRPICGCRWTARRWTLRWQAFTGAAGSQVGAIVAAVHDVVSRYPQAAKYTPGETV